ncbi:MAG: hypothetical protein F6K48_08590 [Okeania sp. SIO3H1]|nr:hypothetical protein [Okeania sp. SIO3H1]
MSNKWGLLKKSFGKGRSQESGVNPPADPCQPTPNPSLPGRGSQEERGII